MLSSTFITIASLASVAIAADHQIVVGGTAGKFSDFFFYSQNLVDKEKQLILVFRNKKGKSILHQQSMPLLEIQFHSFSNL